MNMMNTSTNTIGDIESGAASAAGTQQTFARQLADNGAAFMRALDRERQPPTMCVVRKEWGLFTTFATLSCHFLPTLRKQTGRHGRLCDRQHEDVLHQRRVLCAVGDDGSTHHFYIVLALLFLNKEGSSCESTPLICFFGLMWKKSLVLIYQY